MHPCTLASSPFLTGSVLLQRATRKHTSDACNKYSSRATLRALQETGRCSSVAGYKTTELTLPCWHSPGSYPGGSAAAISQLSRRYSRLLVEYALHQEPGVVCLPPLAGHAAYKWFSAPPPAQTSRGGMRCWVRFPGRPPPHSSGQHRRYSDVTRSCNACSAGAQ